MSSNAQPQSPQKLSYQPQPQFAQAQTLSYEPPQMQPSQSQAQPQFNQAQTTTTASRNSLSMMSMDKEEEQINECERYLDMLNKGPNKLTKKVTWKEGNLLEIVISQKYGGNWEFNADNASIVNQSMSEVSSKIPEDIKSKVDANDIWITIVVLNVLELYYEHKKGSWSLIQRKAVKWLEEKGIDYRKYKEDVKTLY